MNVRMIRVFTVATWIATGALVALAQAGKVRDGEPAIISTNYPESDTSKKVEGFFNKIHVDFTVNQDSGRIISDWYGEHRCGPGFYRCAYKASIRVLRENEHTVVEVQVFQRKREGGINEKPWKEGSTSKGKETEDLTAELGQFLGK